VHGPHGVHFRGSARIRGRFLPVRRGRRPRPSWPAGRPSRVAAAVRRCAG
jgi:hypothetical protein